MITGPGDTVKRARKLRSEMTLPEVKLWAELRKRPGGFKFRRQHAAGNYVLDFYCASVRLCIEVDGFAHDSGDLSRKDKARSHWLRSQGVASTRVPARMVLEDIEAVVLRIVEICEERRARHVSRTAMPLHHPADGPPPRAGEDV